MKPLWYLQSSSRDRSLDVSIEGINLALDSLAVVSGRWMGQTQYNVTHELNERASALLRNRMSRVANSAPKI